MSTETVPELVRDRDWRRLDLRMLLVHPVNEVLRFLPFLIGVFVLGSGGDGGGPWHYLGVAIPIAIGIFRFCSTRFRIRDGQLELRRGILGREIRTAPLDRVRTVELTASLIHRLLGLEKVVIGTGSGGKDDAGLELNALGTAEARRLRHELLSRATVSTDSTQEAPESLAHEEVLVRFDPMWARFAPLTTSGLVVALAALGAAAGPFFGNNIELQIADSDAADRVAELAVPVLIGLGAISLVLMSSVLGVVGYLLANWNFTLSRHVGQRTLHVERGALTRRSTSIDLDRLRGVEIHEPLGLRLAGGGRLQAIATGLGRQDGEGKAPLVPAAPAALVRDVAAGVLGEPSRFDLVFHQHGPAARRRRYLRATLPGLAVVLLVAALAGWGGWPWWTPLVTLALPAAGIALAQDRYARLGHTLTEDYVVIRWGSLRGRTDALRRSGIIGWNINQSFFQRRAGLVSLTATTAAGQQSYEILDVPESLAVAFAAEAVPGLVEQFLV